MVESPHYRELLQLLNDCQVEYLIVGGYAVMKYTEPRYTKEQVKFTRTAVTPRSHHVYCGACPDYS